MQLKQHNEAAQGTKGDQHYQDYKTKSISLKQASSHAQAPLIREFVLVIFADIKMQKAKAS